MAEAHHGAFTALMGLWEELADHKTSLHVW